LNGAQSDGLLDDVTAVVVTFNSARCVDSLVGTLKDFPHVIIADNASSDGCAAALGAALPRARVLQTGRNAGFGAANNIGLAAVSTPYTLLLNPDCTLSLAAIAVLKRWLQEGASVAVPQLLNPAGEGWVPEVNYRPGEFSWRSRAPLAEGALCVDFACAACWLVKTEALRSINGFDERFFLYYEDDDLCLRLRAAGHVIVADPAAQAHHQSGGSTTPSFKSAWMRSKHMARSKVLLTRRHRGFGAALARRAGFLLEGLLGVLFKPLVLDRVGTVRSAGRLVGAATAPWHSQ
jgi:N-acetylglucosaminyl-diphospho-decaprenol L-rhamnosyltransferase